jgi:hypothetical protein
MSGRNLASPEPQPVPRPRVGLKAWREADLGKDDGRSVVSLPHEPAADAKPDRADAGTQIPVWALFAIFTRLTWDEEIPLNRADPGQAVRIGGGSPGVRSRCGAALPGYPAY